MNGCQGIIKKIWFSPGANLQKALPSVVFVECDGYTGNLHCLNKNVKNDLMVMYRPSNTWMDWN
jgi:hypothetical protein